MLCQKYFERLALQKNLLYIGDSSSSAISFLKCPNQYMVIPLISIKAILLLFLNNFQQNVFHLFMALHIHSTTDWINIFIPQIGINEYDEFRAFWLYIYFLLYIYSLRLTVANSVSFCRDLFEAVSLLEMYKTFHAQHRLCWPYKIAQNLPWTFQGYSEYNMSVSGSEYFWNNWNCIKTFTGRSEHLFQAQNRSFKIEMSHIQELFFCTPLVIPCSNELVQQT